MACSYNPLFIYQVLFDLFRGGVFEQHPFLRVEQIKCRHGFQVVHRIPDQRSEEHTSELQSHA